MKYRVEGFAFGTEEEARLAGREAEGIKYMKVRNDMDDPDAVLKLYNRLIEKKIFSTPVGIAFLEELRSYLLTIPYIRGEQLYPLPVYRQQQPPGEEGPAPEEKTAVREKTAGKEKTVGKEETVPAPRRDYHKLFLISTFFAVVFAVSLIGVFVIISLSDDNITILNYENKLIDRYEQWEKELNQRESELIERERALDEAGALDNLPEV